MIVMNKIAICIPTYKRPEMLRKLVLSIIDCKLNKSLIKDVIIIIVDNDIDRTAESTVSELTDRFKSKFDMKYISYPLKGLSNVRNELIKNALTLNPDYLAFVDDDEYVSTDWLNELVKIINASKADIVMGPVITEKNDDVPDDIICWMQRPDHPDNASLNYLRTSNLLIDVKSLLTHDLWFDKRFNTTGGEDSYFGVQMLKKGGTIRWAANAVVYEPVPKNRASISWLAKRYYNGANKFAYVLKIEKENILILKKILVSLLYILFGAIALVFTLFPFKEDTGGC